MIRLPQTSVARQDHQEAIRLARMCRHVPVWAFVIGAFALFNLASAVPSILAVSPMNGMQ